MFKKNRTQCQVLGLRRTDPFSAELNLFSKNASELGWPEGERFLPILDWKYKDIWSFIDEAQIPVASLYS